MWRSLRSRWDYLRYPFPELSVCLFALQAAQIPPDQKRSPAGIRLKQRIYPYLLRSRRAADQFPACLQVHILNYFTSVMAFGYHSFGTQLIHAQLGPFMPSEFYKLFGTYTNKVFFVPIQKPLGLIWTKTGYELSEFEYKWTGYKMIR